MDKVGQDVVGRLLDRLREITNIKQEIAEGSTWDDPVYIVTFEDEGCYEGEVDEFVKGTMPADYIHNRRKDDHQFLAWAKIRTDEKEESKLDAAIWETVVKAIPSIGCQHSDKGKVGYLMAMVASINEIIKNVNPKLIPDLRALETANDRLIDKYLNDIYTEQKFMLNSVSGATIMNPQPPLFRPPLYMMPKTSELNILEVGDVDRYLEFMEAKGRRIIRILSDVVSQDRKPDGSRFKTIFLLDLVSLDLVDANEKVYPKYRLEYINWMKEYRDVYQRAFKDKIDTYRPIIHVLFYSHAICDAIGKKRIFSSNGFKMLLEEAQEVLVYSKAHFKMVTDTVDDRFSAVINDAWDKISKIDYLQFDRTVNASKNGIINDLECRLTVKKDDLDLSFHIHVNNKAYFLAYEHVKHELKVNDEIAVDIIYLSLLKDFAAEYCRDKPLEKPLSKISDDLDIRLMDKLSSVLTVQFIDGGLLDVSGFINDIGGLRYTYSLNYTVEGR